MHLTPPIDLGHAYNFAVQKKHGIWAVTKDAFFYGDYTQKTFAEKAIDVAIADIVAQGGRAFKSSAKG